MTSISLAPDVLIIGGGIAGGGLATVLARAGLDVTVVERVPRFIDRIRGEFVHVWGVREMEGIGLLDDAINRAGGLLQPCWTKYTDATQGDPYRWSDDFPWARGSLSVSHPRLQQALLETAEAAGVTVLRPASLEAVAWCHDHPEVTISAGQQTHVFRPRLLVGADGTHSAVRGHLGGTGVSDPPHHAIGGTLLSGVDLPAGSAHQAWFEGGFAMIFPQRHDVSRVYYVCSTDAADALRRAPQPEALIARLTDVLPAGVMEDATDTGAPTGFFPNSEILATVSHGPATVLIGDAAGSNDPSQGHGLSLVFRDIRDLCERLVAAEDWSPVPAAFASTRTHDHGVLREHARWVAPLSTETGPDADALRARVERARQVDPTAGGFAGIFATGPSSLDATVDARRHFLGEDLPSD